MKAKFLGTKIAVFTKSGQEHLGQFVRPLKEEVVLETDKGVPLCVFKDAIEAWSPLEAEGPEDVVDESIYVVRCSRETFRCTGRVAFSSEEIDDELRERLEQKVVCEHYDEKRCGIVAGDFFDLPPETQASILSNVRIDMRNPSMKGGREASERKRGSKSGKK